MTRDQLFGPRFQRVFPDVYLPRTDVPLDLATRSRAAYLLVDERNGVLGGYSAAELLGAPCAPPNARAEVVLPGAARVHPGLRVRRELIDFAELVVARDCWVTDAARTAWDLARREPLVEAVIAVDALARLGTFVPADLLIRRTKEPGARGCRAIESVVALADPRAESPPESRLRVALVLAGLPVPEVQYPVVDEHGFHLARLDLAYPRAMLAIEYDGAPHFDKLRAVRDRQRDAVLAGYGWLTLRLTQDDLLGMPQAVARIAHLLAQRTPRSTGGGF